LQGTYVVAAVAGEGEEVDLVAVADAAVLPQVRELRCAHIPPPEPRVLPLRRPASEMLLPAPPVRRPGRQEGRRKKGGGSVVERASQAETEGHENE
jgi:hypothetical protein